MQLRLVIVLSLLSALFGNPVIAQKVKVPLVYSNIGIDGNGTFLLYQGNKIYSEPPQARFKPSNFSNITGTFSGLKFDFQAPSLYGTLYYGFIPLDDSKFPQPVFFGKTARIIAGKTEVPIKEMSGEFDMIKWGINRKGILGYRVVNQSSFMVFEGKINFDADDFLSTYHVVRRGTYGETMAVKTKPFKVVHSIIEGPLLANLTHNSVTIFYKTRSSISTIITVNNQRYKTKNSTYHEGVINNLKPDTEYEYQVFYGDFEETYSFRTAPEPGSRKAFAFSYASDSRSGNGGGERNLGGTNAYIMKRIMALNQQNGVKFMQFSGDLITGYVRDPEAIRLEYMNWKRAVSPYGRYIPVVVTMGNHESLIKTFKDPVDNIVFEIDNFPFDKYSSEAIFSQEFVNPLNGPESYQIT